MGDNDRQEPRPTPVVVLAKRVESWRCTACGQLSEDREEIQQHVQRYSGSMWAGEARPMNRGDGIRHQAAYRWTHGPTLTHRAICDGHPVWIIGGLDLEDCQMCQYVLAGGS